MIFGARDVGKDGVLVAFLHQTHGNARHRRLHRNTRVHQGQRSAADRRHRGRTIRFQNVGNDANRVGEIFLFGKNGDQSALRQSTVTDFAAAGPAQESNFTDAERREVVMEHEALERLALQHVQPLLIFAGSERGGDQRLRFAAGEQTLNRACGAAIRLPS